MYHVVWEGDVDGKANRLTSVLNVFTTVLDIIAVQTDVQDPCIGCNQNTDYQLILLYRGPTDIILEVCRRCH